MHRSLAFIINRYVSLFLLISILGYSGFLHAGTSAELAQLTEKVIRSLVTSNEDWERVYGECLRRKMDERAALLCTATMMSEMELTLDVCHERGDDPVDCYAAQIHARNEVNKLLSISKGRPHDINVAANVCSDLHGAPVESEFLRQLLTYVVLDFEGEGAEPLSEDAIMWFDYQELISCVDEMYKKIILQKLSG